MKAARSSVWAIFCGVAACCLTGAGRAQAAAPPEIISVRAENTALLVVAHVPAGFHHAVLEARSGFGPGGLWEGLIAGPLDGTDASVTFRAPLPLPSQILRIRTGVETAVPMALHSGPNFFGVALPNPSTGIDLSLTEAEKIGHVLNRLAYGPTASDVQNVQTLGLESYIQQQLQPELIDESANTRLAGKTDALFSWYQPAEDSKWVRAGDLWHYFKGKQAPPAAWADPSFDDSGWLSGPTGLGYGYSDDATVLADMRKLDPTATSPGQPGYLTVYLRKKFLPGNWGDSGKMIFRVDYDDGFVAYLNGVEVARSNVTGTPPGYNQGATREHEAGTPEEFDITSKTNLLQAGINVLAIELHNVNLTSTDANMIPELMWRQPLSSPPIHRIKGIAQLQQLVHVRGAYSKRQLEAVLGEFWQNHFTTDYNKVTTYFDDLVNSGAQDAMPLVQAMAEAAQAKYTEYEFFYENALGNFGDLLLYSATSPAQIIYLDNVLNVKATPNENYAREIMELFAFGVDNRYTQTDIEQLAKCFTGWTVRKIWPDQQQAFPASSRNPPTEESVKTEDLVLMGDGPGWRYFKGTAEPSPDAKGLPTTDWTRIDFDDSGWLAGATSIGYGDNDDATVLSDMRGKYASVYLRRQLTLANPEDYLNLVLQFAYDDGFVAYLNGVEIGRSRGMLNTGTPPPHSALCLASHEYTTPPDLISLRDFPGLLRASPEVNVLSIQVHNVTLDSSDLSIHVKLMDRRQLPGSIENGDPNGVWTFRFNPAEHDTNAKVLFKDTPYQINIPAGRTGLAGVQDAQDVIEAMVRHPSTAEFICTKLINKFVSDEISLATYRDGTAPEGLRNLLDAAIAAWHSTEPQGNIATVLRTILDPSQRRNFFWSEEAYLSKIKTPVEYINSCLRALDADATGATLPAYNAKLGMQLFTRMEPNGWSELGFNWMDTSSLLQRVKFAQILAENGDSSLHWDVRKLLAEHQVSSADQIVDFFSSVLFQGRLSAANRSMLIGFVTTDDAGKPLPLDPARADYASRVDELVGLILSMPQWQYQ